MADDPTEVDEWLADAALMQQYLSDLQRAIGPDEMHDIVRFAGSVAEAEAKTPPSQRSPSALRNSLQRPLLAAEAREMGSFSALEGIRTNSGSQLYKARSGRMAKKRTCWVCMGTGKSSASAMDILRLPTMR